MKAEDIRKHFGSVKALERETGYTRPAFYHWKKIGYVPKVAQLKLEEYTDGALKYSSHDLLAVNNRRVMCLRCKEEIANDDNV